MKNSLIIDKIFKNNLENYFVIGTGDNKTYEQNKGILDFYCPFIDVKHLTTFQIVPIENVIIINFSPIVEKEKHKLKQTPYQIIELYELIDYKAALFWDNKKTYKGIDKNHYLSNEFFVEKLKKQPNIMSIIENKYFGRNDLVVLSIGCGTGQLERELLEKKICKQIDAFDISRDSISVAINENKKNNGIEINYYCANLNIDVLDINKYDLIIAQECMHHVQNLEFAYSNINKALKEEGLFIQLEYIGSDRFQWSDKQINSINKFLKIIPEKMKNSSVYKRQKLEHIIKADPSEAVRSSEIISLSNKYFKDVNVEYLLGTTMHIVYQCINPAFFHTNNLKPWRNKLFSRILVYFATIQDKKFQKKGIVDCAIITAKKDLDAKFL